MTFEVTIVGGGPAGIAAARAILAESPNVRVHVFEARQNFGGLWNYSAIAGPMYRDLTANVPRRLIGFTGYPFPGQDTDASYPTRQEVADYIQGYSRDITRDSRISVSFGAKVESVVKNVDTKKWLTTTTDGSVFASDFVLLATGHYEFPNWPLIPGLRQHSGVIHSVDYDSPEEFTGKKVLVLGNSRSGTDIVIQVLSRTAPITVSRRREGIEDHLFDADPGSVLWKPEVTKVIGHAVYFSDGSCEVFDRIIVCTGYLYDFPYLKLDSEALQLHDKNRVRLHNLYRHTIFAPDPTLATLGMNKGMVPFPTFEAQGAVIARVWSGRLTIPELSVVLAEQTQIAADRELDEKFHDLPMSLDLDFMRDLWDWADEAPGGFHAERWGKEKLGFREVVLKAKQAKDTENLLESKRIRESLSSPAPSAVPATAPTTAPTTLAA